MDDNDKKTISNKENLTEGNIETASKLSEITNDDGSITYISQITEKKVGTGIIPDAQKVEEISLGVSAEDTKYVDAIRAKKELGILFDDKLSTYISVNAFENILKKMDENLDNYFDALSFGIYSYQEIIELKKSIKTITTEKENIIKYFEVYSEQNNKKLDKFATLNDDIFKSVDRQLEIIKEEEERKKREEEERLRKLKEAEEEKKKWKVLRRKKIKGIFEENMNSYEPFEIMKRRFKQYKEGIEEARRIQNNKEMEEQRKLLRLKKQKEEEEKKKKEEEEKKRKEEERKKKEEEERLKKEEEERKKREEEERKKREEQRLKREEEERKRREEEERIRREEEERIRREEEERKRREEEERKRKEEEERKRKEEKERKRREEEERIKKEEEERKRKIEEEKKRQEAEERKRKEEEERIKREEEERIKREEEEELKRKIEEEKKRQEEEELKRKIEEEKKKQEEEERKRKLDEERIKREEEEEKKRKEEEEKLKKEEEDKRKMEEEKLKKLEEERLKKEEDERIKREQEEKIRREQEEERIKKEKEEKIKEEERKRKEMEEIEKNKKDEELKKLKEEEDKIKQQQEINDKKEAKYLLTLDNIITYRQNKPDKNKNIKIKKKEENALIKKTEEKKEDNSQKEKEKENKAPTNKPKTKNLNILTDESKLPKKNSNKIKPQTNQVKKLEQKKVSKKPLKKPFKKITPIETEIAKKNKVSESKLILTEHPQIFSPSNKTTKPKPKRKSIQDPLIYDDKHIQFQLRYYNDFTTENEILGDDESIYSKGRRNKSAERRTVRKNIDNEQYIQILCNECGEKNYFGNYCENCRGPICCKCKVPHLIENPNHRYNILKNKNYILKKIKREKCTKCEKNLENKNVFKCLNCLNELFCEECKINHNLIYPEHSIIFKTKEKNNDLDSEHSEDSSDNKNISEIIKCLICQKKIKFKDNNYITHCNKCNGNICNNCEKIHSKKKPLHKFISLNTMVINDTSNIENYYTCVNCSKDLNNNLFLYNCPQCNGNLCNSCGNEHFKENPKHKLFILKARLSNIDSNNFDCYICGRDSFNYCEKCKNLFCDKCKENHKQKYPFHKIIKKQRIISDKKDEEMKNNEIDNNNEKTQNCVLCGKKIRVNDKNDLSYCDNCEGSLCKNCIVRHKDYYPNHLIMDSKLKEKMKEKNLNLNKTIKPERKYCHQCKRKLGNNTQYCFRCNEYYCDKCGKSHNFKFPKHKITIEKQKLDDEINKNLYEKPKREKEEIISNLSKEEINNHVDNSYEDKQNLKNLNQNLINHENNEDIGVNNTDKTNKTEKNNYFNISKCKMCGKYKSIQKCCETCKIKLCQICFEKHLKQFTSHDINNREIKQKENYDNNNDNKNSRIKKCKCINCKKNMNLKNNETIIFCGKCKGNICENCKKSHFSKYPKHNQITSKIFFFEDKNTNTNTNKFTLPEIKCIICKKDLSDKIKEPIATCFKCKGNLCKECARSHNTEFMRHKLENKLFIFNSNNEEKIKEDSNKNLNKNKNECIICRNIANFQDKDNDIFCFKCDGIICENCIKIHFKNNDNHKTIPIKKTLKQNNKLLSNLQNFNCSLCNSDITDNINNSIVFNCSQCDGDLCDECGKDHLINKPKHNMSVIKYILEENILPSNCSRCGKNLKNISNYQKCENCKLQYCIKCGDYHKQRHKYHNVVTIKKDNGKMVQDEKIPSNKDTPNFDQREENLQNKNDKEGKYNIEKCHLCLKNLFSNENTIINHCFDCKCNFCIKCLKKHIKNNNSHDLNLFEVKLLNEKENQYKNEPYYICDICGDTLNTKNAFYKCENCESDLCEKCLYIHYKSKPNHNFILVKYKNINEEINDNDNNFYKKKYPFENSIPDQNLSNEFNESNINDLVNSPIIRNKNCCNNCRIKLDEYSKNICNFCKMIFCNECIIYHYEQNNVHRLLKNSSQKYILTKNMIPSKEQIEKCNKCLKLCNYSSIYKCNQCKIKLCPECSISHNKMFSLHKLSLLKNIPNQNEENEEESRKIKCDCLFCKASHSNNPNRFFYICSECNGNICSLCKKIHDNKFYSHILVFPHKYGEETDINKKNRRSSSVG